MESLSWRALCIELWGGGQKEGFQLEKEEERNSTLRY